MTDARTMAFRCICTECEPERTDDPFDGNELAAGQPDGGDDERENDVARRARSVMGTIERLLFNG